MLLASTYNIKLPISSLTIPAAPRHIWWSSRTLSLIVPACGLLAIVATLCDYNRPTPSLIDGERAGKRLAT